MTDSTNTDNLEHLDLAIAQIADADARIEKAIAIGVKYGGIDGAHHKDWVIDQMVRALAGEPLQAKIDELSQQVGQGLSAEEVVAALSDLKVEVSSILPE